MFWNRLLRLFGFGRKSSTAPVAKPSPTTVPKPSPVPASTPTISQPLPPTGDRATIRVRVNSYIQNMGRLDQIRESLEEFEQFIEANSRIDLDVSMMYSSIAIPINHAVDGCFVDPHSLPISDFPKYDVYIILWETNGKAPRLGGETWGGDENGILNTPVCLVSIDNWWNWVEWKGGTGRFKYTTTQIIIHEFMNAIRWLINSKYGLHMPNTYGNPPEFDLTAYPDGLKGGYAALFKGLTPEMIQKLKGRK